MLTTNQVEVLERWRKFVPRDDAEEAPELTDDDAAAIACQTMIAAYCKNPERVDWSDLSKALEQAQGAFGFERNYADQVVAALAAEAADRKENEKLFPLAAWQKDVADGKTQLGYDEWVKERREAARHKPRVGMRWGLVALAVGASLWLLSYVAWLPAGLLNILAGATQ
jgi:hypothetical protein